MRFVGICQYDGSNYSGFQSQKNAPSVQDHLELAIASIGALGERINYAGRTDAGVHAIEQSAHFKTNYKIDNKSDFIKSLNYFLLDYDISILNIIKRKNDFHSRHSAKKRIYKYIIINRQSNLSLEKNRAWYLRKKLNINTMKKGSEILKGIKDFSTFRASSCSAKSPLKKIYSIKISKVSEIIKIKISSKSFLQNQVRSMVGCLKYLSTYKWSLNDFKKAFKSKKRINCAPPAPACGLYLSKIKY